MTKHDLFSELQTLTSPTVVYLLGFLWGDGYIRAPYNKITGGHSYRITLNIVTDDAVCLLPLFAEMPFVRVRTGKTRPNRRPTTTIEICDKRIYQWLAEHDYEAKSWKSPDTLLSKIPVELRRYWFRGLIDADGTIRLSPQRIGREQGKGYMSALLSVFSGFDQDWTYLSRECDRRYVRYSIRTRVRKQGRHQSSSFTMTRRPDILVFGNWIWDGMEADRIGLSRKWRRFQEIQAYDRAHSRSTIGHAPAVSPMGDTTRI